jgi:hypothetical protein
MDSVYTTPSKSSSYEAAAGPRQRNTARKTSSNSRRQEAPARHATPRTRRTYDERPSLWDTLIHMLVSSFLFLWDIVLMSLSNVKKPISYIVGLWILAGIGMLITNLMTASIYTALTPVCRIPGVSLLHLPICSYSSPYDTPGHVDHPRIDATGSAPDPEFSSLMHAQDKLSEVLEDATSSLSLPLSMKRSESSIRDLRQIVRFSSLDSRNELVLEFDGFIETARAASFDLQKFNSHVGRTVDVTLSTARWTERMLDDMAHQSSPSTDLLPRFVSSLLYPFTPIPFTQSRLLDQYIVHSSLISSEISALTEEAQALLMLLQNLEDRLDVIHGITFSAHQNTQISKDEILSHLWTMVGGNRAQVSKHNRHLDLLRQVGQYRTQAFAHVSGTILKLQAMGSELEELRTRVDAAGLEKEMRGRDRVPLEVHIQSIKMGVERLEEGRAKARAIENKYVRNVIDVSQSGQLGVDEQKLGLLDG